jgi:hypothetical protein
MAKAVQYRRTQRELLRFPSSGGIPSRPDACIPTWQPVAHRRNCEADKAVRVEGRVGYEADKCGAHYFVMSDEGPRLIRRVLDDK